MGKNTNEIKIKVAKMLNVSLSLDQISTSHRLQTRLKPKNSEPAASPPIIVRFLSRDVRNQLYANRKLARTANLQEFSLQGAENIYINENLTQSRKKLFWHAKQKAVYSNFKFYWTVNGNVYARLSCPSSGPRSCFVWLARPICEVDLLRERLTILRQIKRQSKPKPSSVWFPRNHRRFAAKTFFF